MLDGLASLRTAGWRVAVVTNGGVVQQSRKLEHTGIAGAVDYCCISEAAGVRKPDRRIFAIAAGAHRRDVGGGWMVGDHPSYDIAGGIAAGLCTIRIGSHHPTAAAPVGRSTHHFASVLQAFPVSPRSVDNGGLHAASAAVHGWVRVAFRDGSDHVR